MGGLADAAGDVLDAIGLQIEQRVASAEIDRPRDRPPVAASSKATSNASDGPPALTTRLRASTVNAMTRSPVLSAKRSISSAWRSSLSTR
jgi:hypothetical protein